MTSAATTGSYVGRADALAELRAGADRAADGVGSLVLLAGEAGIGKTRTADETAAYAQSRGALVLRGTCWEGDGVPAFWPWVQVLRACARAIDLDALRGDIGLTFDDLVVLVPEVSPAVPPAGATVLPLTDDARAQGPQPSGPGLDPDQARFRLFDAVATFLGAASRARPLLVVLDDLHWADRATLLVLQFVARELPRTRALVIGAYRDVDAVGDGALGAALPDLARYASIVTLRGLEAAEVAALVQTTIGGDVPTDLAPAIHRQTAGNPLFVREVARLLASQGRLTGDTTPALPQTVRDVLERRIARLSQPCHKALVAAAVLGHEFDLESLRAMLGAARDVALELVEEAAAARLVAAMPDTIATYSFSHALVRETLLASLSARERAALHRSAGESLEALHASELDGAAARIASHFVRAAAAGDAAKAVEYSERAAHRALAALAYEDAAGHLERALEAFRLLGADEDREAALVLQLADARMWAGDLPAARDVYDRAAALARKRNRPDELARAALGFGSGLGGFEVRMFDARQIELLEEALRALPADPSPLRAWLLARLSVALSFVESGQRRITLAREAVEMATTAGDDAAHAYALSAVCDAIAGPDHVRERLAHADEMLRLALSACGHASGEQCSLLPLAACFCGREMELLARRFRVVALLELGDAAAVDAEIDAYARVAEGFRQPLYSWYVPLWHGMRAHMLGLFDDARAFADEAEAIGERAHSVNARLLATTLRMAVDKDLGRVDALRRAIESTLALVDADLTSVPSTRLVFALLDALAGQHARARAELTRAAASGFAGVERDAEWLATMTYAAEACVETEHAEAAARLYELLLPYADLFVVDGIGAACYGALARPIAALARVVGRHDEAEDLLVRALAANERAASPLLVAHTKAEYARLLRARGDDADAARVEAEVAAVRAALGLDGVVRLPRTDEAAFAREGEFWTIAYGDRTVRMKDSKGLRDIAFLLGAPGREVHVADLISAEPARPVAATAAAQAGLSASGPAADPVLDARARAEFRARLVELQEELDDAEAAADPARASKARGEMDFIAGELASAYGLGGRARRAGDPAERARKAVTARIRDAISKIEREHSSLGRHLARGIRTGAFCAYDPEDAPLWRLRT